MTTTAADAALRTVGLERLADDLEGLVGLIRKHAVEVERRANDWTQAVMPRQWEPGDEEEDELRRNAVSLDDDIDRQGNAAAARMQPELKAATRRVETETRRLRVLLTACIPIPQKQLGTRDMLLAQVAAAGYCVSCWRNEKHLTDTAKGRYKDRCRFCGDWKGEHGQDPPLPILRLKHDMRTITTAAVLEAMGKAG